MDNILASLCFFGIGTSQLIAIRNAVLFKNLGLIVGPWQFPCLESIDCCTQDQNKGISKTSHNAEIKLINNKFSNGKWENPMTCICDRTSHKSVNQIKRMNTQLSFSLSGVYSQIIKCNNTFFKQEIRNHEIYSVMSHILNSNTIELTMYTSSYCL